MYKIYIETLPVQLDPFLVCHWFRMTFLSILDGLLLSSFPYIPDEDADSQMVLKEASSRLQSKFHFHTTTIQIENYSEDMRDCEECQDPTD